MSEENVDLEDLRYVIRGTFLSHGFFAHDVCVATTGLLLRSCSEDRHNTG